MARNLYVDASSLIRVATQTWDWADQVKIIDAHRNNGGKLVSSRLLELECRRFVIRGLLTNQPKTNIEYDVKQVELIPIDDDIWRVAMGITQNTKAADAIHLATCSLIPDVELLTSDKNMASVAQAMGIRLAR